MGTGVLRVSECVYSLGAIFAQVLGAVLRVTFYEYLLKLICNAH